jgi:hypothetical protein
MAPSPPRLIGLEKLDRQERAACLLAVHVLDVAEAEAWDVGGRQRAVDAMLTLRDGRKAAFEVTNLGEDDALDLARLLGNISHKWPVAGDWHWRVEVGSAADLERLEGCYGKIIRICEAAGEPYPDKVTGELSADPDLQWLIRESSSEMVGFPNILAKNLSHPMTEVLPPGGAGFLDESLSGFAVGLSKAFEKPHIKRHFDKLARAGTDERHLFIPLHDSAFPFSVFSELMFKETLPPDPPVIPDSVTHLWLAPAGSRRVLLWTRDAGWQNHPATLV